MDSTNGESKNTNGRDEDLPGEPTSLWLATTPGTDFPPLESDLTVDVAIIGGGMVGLTAATLLKAQGQTVAVIEAKRIVESVTGHTTAKVTSLHSLIYHDLVRHFGEDKARAYGEANQAAIEQIASLVAEWAIDCDFGRARAYTYTEKDADLERIKAEAEVARSLGLPAAFTVETPLPFSVRAAVYFENQAQFHPRKYLLALAQRLPGEGSHIFEETRALELDDGEPCVVTTERGTVTARDIIIASHFPFGDKALYATRLSSHRSYVLAVQLDKPLPQALLNSMFISTEPTHSLRSQMTAEGELLLIGGEGHKTGEGGDTVARYERLEQWTRERFGAHRVAYRWSTQDNQTLDGVPYIGRATPGSSHVYVATGFGGWGMTNSTVAGMLLRDLILGSSNPWAEVYDPNRVKFDGVGQFFRQGATVARHFIGDRLGSADPEGVMPGEGKVVKGKHGPTALYRGKDGTVARLSPVCTHMGCHVTWNPAEKSWDCPCHGSRFAADGEVIHGPALTGLKKLVNKS